MRRNAGALLPIPLMRTSHDASDQLGRVLTEIQL